MNTVQMCFVLQIIYILLATFKWQYIFSIPQPIRAADSYASIQLFLPINKELSPQRNYSSDQLQLNLSKVFVQRHLPIVDLEKSKDDIKQHAASNLILHPTQEQTTYNDPKQKTLFDKDFFEEAQKNEKIVQESKLPGSYISYQLKPEYRKSKDSAQGVNTSDRSTSYQKGHISFSNLKNEVPMFLLKTLHAKPLGAAKYIALKRDASSTIIPLASNLKTLHPKKHACKILKKHLVTDSQQKNKYIDMNCFLCEDPHSQSKVLQCFKNDLKRPPTYYSSNWVEKSSSPQDLLTTYRYKRFINDDNTYEEFTSSTSPNNEQQSSNEEGDDSDGFYTDSDYDVDRSQPYQSNNEQNRGDQKDHCHEKVKGNMLCTICYDINNESNYEKCSYNIQPEEESYSYSSQKRFDSKKKPEEYSSKTLEPNEQRRRLIRKKNRQAKLRKQVPDYNRKPKYQSEKGDNSNEIKPERRSFFGRRRNDYRDPELKSHSKPKDPVNKNSKKTKNPYYKQKDKSSYEDFENPFDSGEFLDFQQEGSDHTSSSKKDVKDVLAEFNKKDRSSCKKKLKNGMTCYVCVNSKGIRNEECMYLSDAKPDSNQEFYVITSPHYVDTTEYRQLRYSSDVGHENDDTPLTDRSVSIAQNTEESDGNYDDPVEQSESSKRDVHLNFMIPSHMFELSKYEDHYRQFLNEF